MKSETFKFKDDVVGLVFPTYGFGLPNIVGEFLKRVTWEAAYTFAVATYGNLTGGVLWNLRRFAERYGKKFDYTATLLMVDNYLPNFEMNDQLRKLPDRKVDEHLSAIIADIENRKKNMADSSLSQKIASIMIGAAAKAFMNGKTARGYIVNENCTKCGVCAKVCPTRNIEITDRVKFGDRCESCYGCVHQCPQNAIHLKTEKSAARFRNEHVSLKEIIDANCQL